MAGVSRAQLAIAEAFAPVLTAEGLEHIANYKYVPSPYTALDWALQPAWNYLVTWLPRRMAPNLVTLSGLIPVLLAYLSLCLSVPTLSQPPPWWSMLLFSVASIFYFAMDNLDGKQARRTGSSSPLGHLFDHGVDTLVVVPYHAFIVLGVVRMGASRGSLASQLVVQVSFFLAQWAERHTTVCPTAGISEMCLMSSALALAVGLLPQEALEGIFSIKVPGVGVDLRSALIIALSVNGAVYLTYFVTSTLRSLHGDRGRCSIATLELIPVAFTVAAAALWPQAVVEEAALSILIITGLLMFFLTSQIIVFSMAEQPFPLHQRAVMAYSMLSISARCGWLEGHAPTCLWLAACATILCVGCWVAVVMCQIKARLGIFAFTIQPK
mmetsp:Transcript_62273/g.115581  ORF Transcript_62273/g.115581 Transcript_62273/m.115581 type:complete len:382 (-) Transcript_62273:53-1198(-)